MPRSPRGALLVGFAALVCAAAGCGTTPEHPAAARRMNERAGHGRFTVTFSAAALGAAKTAGTSLPRLVASDLGRIDALLPGPETTISVSYNSQPSSLIPKNGTFGFTDPLTGSITAGFGPVPQVSIERVLTFWLPRDLAHEVNHSVRILAGPGFGTTLLPELISEGTATAFDQAAFPGPPDPWTHAITPAQECALWTRAKPQLDGTGLYDLWMFGGAGVPNWAGFTIGYHIVADYRSHHPDVSWATLTATGAAAILAGSDYQPCSR